MSSPGKPWGPHRLQAPVHEVPDALSEGINRQNSEADCSPPLMGRQTRRAMYVEHNNEARSCNHCYSGKAISVTYSECVCL